MLMESMIIALSMYSQLPMPRVDWNARNMQYALCFLPVVGAIAGGALLLLHALLGWIGAGGLLRAALAALMPLVITGGIHMDGYMDTSDALASHQPTEKKLEIMKDPHVGAFGAMAMAGYLLICFALYAQLHWHIVDLGVLALGFVLSRALSALAVAAFPCAKGSGLAHTFQSMSARSGVKRCSAAVAAVAAIGMVAVHPASGVLAAAAAISVFGYYRHVSIKQFGGITGDLAGWFLQICELMILAAVVLVQLIAR